MSQAQTNGQLAKILEGITALRQKGHRVIWWSDPGGEFAELTTELEVEQAQFIRLCDEPALALKRRMVLALTQN